MSPKTTDGQRDNEKKAGWGASGDDDDGRIPDDGGANRRGSRVGGADVPVAALARGLDVLEDLVSQGVTRVDDVSRRLGIPTSTIYRYVKALRLLGFLDEVGGAYMPGARLVTLAFSASRSQYLVNFADPILHWLVEKTRETALLTVQVGTEAMCLDRVESPRPIRLSYSRGAIMPLSAGASGKVLLAYAEPSVIRKVVDTPQAWLSNRTDTAADLGRQLGEIRSRGIAITVGDIDDGAVGMAVPVFARQALMCALTVAGPVARFDAPQRQRVERVLREAAARLGRDLSKGSAAWILAGTREERRDEGRRA